MSDKSAIEWTDSTWNPTTGCTKVSEGCRHCYIDRTPPFRIKGIRFLKDGDPSNEIGATTGVLLHEDRLDQPLRWKRPRRVFVNSLSDLFHDDIPDEFIGRVFDTMLRAEQHIFQVLTKRPRRMQRFVTEWLGESYAQWIPNLWSWTHAVFPDGRVVDRGPKPPPWQEPWEGMEKLGKKLAGRELDGRTWDEMPELVSA